MEATMRLDKEYLRESTPEEEAAWLERVPPELDWDESEASLVVAEIVGRGYASDQVRRAYA
jgi:hypothetical protein